MKIETKKKQKKIRKTKQKEKTMKLCAKAAATAVSCVRDGVNRILRTHRTHVGAI